MDGGGVFLLGGERGNLMTPFRLLAIFTKMAQSPAPQGSLPSAPPHRPHFACPTSDGLLPVLPGSSLVAGTVSEQPGEVVLFSVPDYV